MHENEHLHSVMVGLERLGHWPEDQRKITRGFHLSDEVLSRRETDYAVIFLALIAWAGFPA